MTVAHINLLEGDSHGSETDYRTALPVNMSGIVRPMFGAAGYMLQQPGLTQYADGEGVDRGGFYNDRMKVHFRLSGTSFIKVTAGGVVTVLGTIPGTDTASLPYSFNTQAIIANGGYYLYDDTKGFRRVTDSDTGSPIDGVWIDNYYFMTDGENLFHTELTSEDSIDPLDFATAEFMPDDTLGLAKTSDNKVMVFGRYTIEYFTNDASPEFAFTRLTSRALKIGIVGTHCKCAILDNHFIMGGRREEGVAIHAIGVGSINKVSSREVDKMIGQYTKDQLSASVLETRVEDGYQYVIVHLPNEVLLYNVKVAQAAGNDQGWTILKSDVNGNKQWRGKHGVFESSKGVWVYGDKDDGRIGILDETVATHYDDLAEWALFTPFMELETYSINKLQIETIPGFTASNDATVFFSITYDGVTHGREYTLNYGGVQEYKQRFIARALGYCGDWLAFKFRAASRSRMCFSRGSIDYD